MRRRAEQSRAKIELGLGTLAVVAAIAAACSETSTSGGSNPCGTAACVEDAGITDASRDGALQGLDAASPSPDTAVSDAADGSIDGPDALSIEVSPASALLTPDAAASFAVKVSRPAGIVGPVDVYLDGLGPVGFVQKHATIAAADTTGTVTVTASVAAPQGDFDAKMTALLDLSKGANPVTLKAQANVAVTMNGAPGMLATRFGTQGVLSFSMGEYTYPYGLATQPDGKILLAVSSQVGMVLSGYLLRRNADGTADPTFGAQGSVLLPCQAGGLALRPDGKIITAGREQASGKLCVSQWTSSGLPDTTFAPAGVSTTKVSLPGKNIDPGRIALQPDGKVVVPILACTGGGDCSAALLRTTANGLSDPGFGAGGFVETTTAYGFGFVLPQPDGKLLALGDGVENGVGRAVLARYTSDGLLDVTFGAAGYAYARIGLASTSGTALLKQADGKIVASLALYDGTDKGYVQRWSVAGTVDTTFGQGGVAIVSNQGGLIPTALALGPAGTLWVGGGNGSSIFAARLSSNGSVDASFGGVKGFVQHGQLNQASVSHLAPLTDGKLLLVYGGGNGADVRVSKMWP